MSYQKDKYLHRRRSIRRKKRTILIVGEGRETEPNYFHALKQVQSVCDRYSVTVKRGSGGSRVQILQGAVDKKLASEYRFDEVWCVFDAESLSSEDAIKDYRSALAIAKKNGITVAVSNPSFEVWLLAHFTRSSRAYANGDAVLVELNKIWREKFKCDYDKSDIKVYEKIASLTEDAIENCKSVRRNDHHGRIDIAACNSASDVYLLVAKLLKGDEHEKGKGRRKH